MTGIIVAIILLIVGYYFLTNYEKIDHFVCQSEKEEYVQFGLWPIFICTFLGAVNGCIFIYEKIINSNAEINPDITYTIYILAIITGAIGIYETFFRINNPEIIIRKIILLIFSCAFAMLIGIIASVAVILILIICAIMILVEKSAIIGIKSSRSNITKQKGTLFGNDGSIRQIKDISSGSGMTYLDDRGEEWEHQIGGYLKNKETGEEVNTWIKKN